MLKKIVFLATAWGSRHGGVNTINSEICIALASILTPTHRIVCAVLEESEEEIRSAASLGVSLVSVGKSDYHNQFEHSRAYDVISAVQELGKGDVLWWVGHDTITGRLALEAQRISKQGRVAIFHHTNYFAYTTFKHRNGELAIQKKREQADLFSRADAVFAIGPKLAGNARAILGSKGEEKVLELIPGLPDVHPKRSPDKFTGITFGRMDRDDDIVKQGRLAVAAFSKAVADHPDILGNDASLVVLGASNEEAVEANRSSLELANRYAGRMVNIIVTPYVENRRTLLGMIADSSICLMLSLHEGFGLTGWEAIAAEVPLLVSKNSGLFEFIKENLGGQGIGCLTAIDVRGAIGEENFSEEDVKGVAEAIMQVKLRLQQAKEDAKRLRGLLADKYTWRNTALAVASKCGIQLADAGGDPSARVVQALESGLFEEIVPRRAQHFEQLWAQLDRVPSRLVLFGGVSSSLCDARAAKAYAAWLVRNAEAQLFVCYESGQGARLRAAILDEAALDASEGLSTKAIERMEQKEKKVLALRDHLADLVSGSVLNRVHFIPLVGAITNYLMITDFSIFWAPVLHTRSSKAASIRLPRGDSPLRQQLFGFILFQLSLSTHSNSVEKLRQEIKAELEEGNG